MLGISVVSGSSIVAEIGVHMAQYPRAAHLASWAALCPGEVSAGKRRSGRTRKGNRWLRRTMSEAAWAASHTKDAYFPAQFRRIAARRGKKGANIAGGSQPLGDRLYHSDRSLPLQGSLSFVFRRPQS